MTYIKICGLTRSEDVLAAAEMGADMLGFIHVARSPRFVRRTRLGSLLSLVPPGLRRVIVVRDSPAAELDLLRHELVFDDFQFHGGETRESLKRWGGYLVVAIAGDQPDLRLPARAGSPFMLDTRVGEHGGGTGVTFDWSILAGAPGRFLVAGGLTPDNVGDLIRQYRPWGVDVSSGIESEPGRKDHDKMRQFIQNARRADP